MNTKVVANTRETDRLANLTSLQGYVHTKYEELVDIFGPPGEGDGYKVRAYWSLLFTGKDVSGLDTKIVATIYDWKQSDAYNGEGNGTPLDEVTEWNIGGHGPSASDAVHGYIENWHQERLAQMANAYDTFCVETWDRV
jgi:hypothetical protein